VEADRDRIVRIRELQAVMGFNLQDIRQILSADDRLAEPRGEFLRSGSPKRHRDIVIEAARLNARTQGQVRAKIGVLEDYLAELGEKADRYQTKADELGITLPPNAVVPAEADPAAV
jgi:DNA-binding transcriptional MerR regulator